jgi:hypothetical protein
LFVCIEDSTSHVELFAEELCERGWSRADPFARGEFGLLERAAAIFRHAVEGVALPRVFWNTPSFSVAIPDTPEPTGVSVSVRGMYDESGKPRERRSFDTEPVVFWGEKFCTLESGELVVVRPVRERCRFFKRQLLGNDDEADKDKPGGKIGFKNCERRRSVGGAFLSLANEAVFACDYRDPPDRASVERWLDSHERKILETNPHGTLVPIFNLEGSSVKAEMLDPSKQKPEPSPIPAPDEGPVVAPPTTPTEAPTDK